MSKCRLHGRAYTTGCPGCETAYDTKMVRSRQRWWRLTNLCNRFGHSWKTIEPGVYECRICHTSQFTNATMPQLERWLKR